MNTQQQRSKEETKMIEAWEKKCREIFGNGFLFADVFMKTVQDWDLRKVKPGWSEDK